jgi:hypothetical protein
VPFYPDVIHGHHRITTLTALAHFPRTPALFICHHHRSHLDAAPLHPRIYRYFGVSQICLERLRQDGVPESQLSLLLNWVDVQRFLPRPPLPPQPQRALVFSNYATADTYLPMVIEACQRAQLPLDVIGSGVGRAVPRPEEVLGQYDIVFAKAKAAMEAMAVGAAVVLCDLSGVGPMVTATEFHRLRRFNFGFQALTEPMTPEVLLRQIARYDPDDAARVRDLLRADASLEQSVATLVSLYRHIVEVHGRSVGVGDGVAFKHRVQIVADAIKDMLIALWLRLPRRLRTVFLRFGPARVCKLWVQRLVFGYY